VSTTDVPSNGASVKNVDLKLEVVLIPVSDVDRAKEFYGSLGWRLDADFPFDNGFRVVQFTPPGSDCSVQFGTNMTSAPPGSAQGNYLIVSDIEGARSELAAHGVDVSEVFHPGTPGAQFQPDGTNRPCQRTRAGSRQLQLLRHVQGPGRQRLVAAGDYDAAAPSHRRCRDGIRIRIRPGKRASSRGRGPRRAREAYRRG
jgi:catechol 2,3-dioxygenase-like lactoylglutathione lyase family enzyme